MVARWQSIKRRELLSKNAAISHTPVVSSRDRARSPLDAKTALGSSSSQPGAAKMQGEGFCGILQFWIVRSGTFGPASMAVVQATITKLMI